MGKWRKLYTACTVGLLVITLTSCDKKQNATPIMSTPSPIETEEPTIISKETEPPAKVEPGNVSANSIQPEKPPEEGSKQTEQPTKAPRAEIAPKDAYNVSKPTLMGLKLNTTRSATITQLGDPKSEFTLEDDDGIIHVLDYETFSVGINGANKVEFIEIQSDQIDPGLGGIKIGSKPSQVVTLLGKPSTNSSYVITYESPQAVLKLDIDIEKDRIISIKLFPDK